MSYLITPGYDKIRDELDTGDCVLFSGKGGVSSVIKFFSMKFNKISDPKSPLWSHLGMVVKSEELGCVFLWESTTLSDVEDYESGKHVRGVQLVLLSERLKTYNGEVAVRRLECERTPEMMSILKDLREELRGRPYEKKKLQLIKAAYDGKFGMNEEDLSSIFCSELFTECYQRWGFISKSVPSNEYIPVDYSTLTKKVDKDLLNASLKPESFLKTGADCINGRST